MLEHKTRLNLYVLLAFFLTITACDSGGGIDNGDDNSPPNASVTANTTDPVVGDTVALDASKSDDPDGDELSFSWTLETPGGSNATLSSPTAARRWYVPDTSGDYRAEVAVSDSKLSDTDDVSMEALEKLPETVTVPFENIADDGDSLVAQAMTWRDSVVTETKRSGTAVIPAAREPGAFCAREGDLFAEDCISLTPTGDYTKTQTLRVDRKEVSVSVGLDLPYGSADETDVTVLEPFGADSTTFTGENTLTLPKRSASMERRLVADLVTEEPDRSDHVDRLVADTTVSAHESNNPTLSLEKLTACNDSIDNDPNDELVDVWEDTNGDGIASKGDVGDPGCTNPEDDNERHRIVSTVFAGNDADQRVSNAEGERVEELLERSNNFNIDESVQDAVAGILFGNDVEQEIDDSGEEFAFQIEAGSKGQLQNSTETGIVLDEDTTDGWWTPKFVLEANLFEDGHYVAVIGIHASKIRDEPPGDGGSDVFFIRKEGDEFRITFFSWAVEEEDFEDSDNSTTKRSGRQKAARNCRYAFRRKVCTKVVRIGYPKRQ